MNASCETWHLEKVYWPQARFTRGDMLHYDGSGVGFPHQRGIFYARYKFHLVAHCVGRWQAGTLCPPLSVGTARLERRERAPLRPLAGSGAAVMKGYSIAA